MNYREFVDPSTPYGIYAQISKLTGNTPFTLKSLALAINTSEDAAAYYVDSISSLPIRKLAENTYITDLPTPRQIYDVISPHFPSSISQPAEA